LCLFKILAKDRMALKKATLVSTFLRKLVRTLAWISRRHKLSPLTNLISYESLCPLKILAKDRMARKKAILVYLS
jgi:hypothetical protein